MQIKCQTNSCLGLIPYWLSGYPTRNIIREFKKTISVLQSCFIMMLSGKCQAAGGSILFGVVKAGIHYDTNMAQPYQTTYDSKTKIYFKIAVFYSLSNLVY